MLSSEACFTALTLSSPCRYFQVIGQPRCSTSITQKLEVTLVRHDLVVPDRQCFWKNILSDLCQVCTRLTGSTFHILKVEPCIDAWCISTDRRPLRSEFWSRLLTRDYSLQARNSRKKRGEPTSHLQHFLANGLFKFCVVPCLCFDQFLQVCIIVDLGNIWWRSQWYNFFILCGILGFPFHFHGAELQSIVYPDVNYTFDLLLLWAR